MKALSFNTPRAVACLAAACFSGAVLAGPLGTPTLATSGSTSTSIDVGFTAGSPGGAPAGFSLQWMSAADFAANGGLWYLSDDARLCKASFSGVPGYFAGNFNSYTLAAGESTEVTVGDITFDQGASSSCNMPLACGTTYVFRTFSHAVPKSSWKRSEFSANMSASTLPCNPPPSSCTLTQGFWKTHGALGPASKKDELGAYISEWPVSTLMLGTTSYDELQLLAILNRPAQGNGLVALAHQLIAAKLNIASGADGTAIHAQVAAADAMIASLVVPPVGSGSLKSGVTSELTGSLDDYNSGITGPGHCD